MQLSTSRLVLREILPDDAEDILAYASDPEVCRYSPWGPSTMREVQKFVGTCVVEQETVPRTAFTLAVTHAGHLIGAATLVVLDANRAELGYVLRRDAWGQGFATEAASGLIDWGFSQPYLSTIIATCRPANSASAAVLKKIGMSQKELLSNHMWMRDHWEDSLLFSMGRPQ